MFTISRYAELHWPKVRDARDEVLFDGRPNELRRGTGYKTRRYCVLCGHCAEDSGSRAGAIREEEIREW